MSDLVWLVPIALGMGLVGLIAFLWSMRSGQYEDLDGAAERVLLADAAETPLGGPGRRSFHDDRSNNRDGQRAGTHESDGNQHRR